MRGVQFWIPELGSQFVMLTAEAPLNVATESTRFTGPRAFSCKASSRVRPPTIRPPPSCRRKYIQRPAWPLF